MPTTIGSSKKQESSRKTSTSALLTTPKPFTMWITTNRKILQEMGIPDHLTCLLRNLYTTQEATVRTRHGTTDWFQIRKAYIKMEYCHPTYLTYMESEGEGEVAQSCPTLCDPVDCSLPGFSIHEILQARILEWVTISFSRGSSRPRDRTQLYSHWRQTL